MTDLHLIYTEAGDDFGWTIESPQIPELIGGRSTGEELVEDTPAIIDWAVDEDASFDEIYAHEQHLIEDPQGRQYLIRWQFNDEGNYDERYQTASRLNYAVTSGMVTPEEFGEHPALPLTGERLYIAVIGTDTLGWIQDQLSDRECCCVLAQHLEDGAVIHPPCAPSGVMQAGLPIEKLGLHRDSTFSEMLDAVLAREVESLWKTQLPSEATREIPSHIVGTKTALS